MGDLFCAPEKGLPRASQLTQVSSTSLRLSRENPNFATVALAAIFAVAMLAFSQGLQTHQEFCTRGASEKQVSLLGVLLTPRLPR